MTWMSPPGSRLLRRRSANIAGRPDSKLFSVGVCIDQYGSVAKAAQYQSVLGSTDYSYASELGCHRRQGSIHYLLLGLRLIRCVITRLRFVRRGVDRGLAAMRVLPMRLRIRCLTTARARTAVSRWRVLWISAS